MPDDLPALTVTDETAWRAWLVEQHATSTGVWLTLARKGTTEPTALRYQAALEEALCFGWIDGQVRAGDAGVYRQRFTPRRPRSPWSRRNVGLVERLTAEGRMHPAGSAAVESARADGRWAAAYAGQATAQVPADLAAALEADGPALQTWRALTSQNRYAVIYRVEQAKRAETRARRIAEFVAMLARGETLHPQKPTRG